MDWAGKEGLLVVHPLVRTSQTGDSIASKHGPTIWFHLHVHNLLQEALYNSGVPIIDYNRSLIENLKRRDNRLWKMFSRLSQKKVFSIDK